MDTKIPGLYIHIPFCLRKCPYCDFYSVTALVKLPPFLAALNAEMELYRGEFAPFDTIYIGGGTPSLLAPHELAKILARVRENFPVLPDTEITLETNPADMDEASFAAVRGMGVNRLTIGCQSFDQTALAFLGRRHTAEQAENAITAARRAGFTNIGVDLIYGIPDQGIAAWRATLERCLAYRPEHLSCYQLTVEDGTLLGERCRTAAFSLPDEELAREFFLQTAELLEEAGYVHYEVSNFARSMAFASRHNQKYWDHTPYLGLGPGAHSFAPNRRWWNYRSLDRYLDALAGGERPVEGVECLTEEQLRLEAFYLGLRTKQGICLQNYAHRYHVDLTAQKKDSLSILQTQGLITIEGGYLHPTRAGLAVADSLALL
jgi:oxygen-independent coproporphyrinogen-3 oxidase